MGRHAEGGHLRELRITESELTLQLQQFAGKQGNWGHLDIAGPAANFGKPWGCTSTEGTGFGVRTLVEVAKGLAQ